MEDGAFLIQQAAAAADSLIRVVALEFSRMELPVLQDFAGS